MNWIIFQLFVLIELSFSLAPHEIAIIIFSQTDTYHLDLAQTLRAEIYNQSVLINKDDLVNVYLSHTFHHPGDWTLLPILPKLITKKVINQNTKWLMVCEDRSIINLKLLIESLTKEDHTKEMYLGYPLYDQEATIIHHFAFFENPQWFPYPMMRAGVVFTTPLIKSLAKHVQMEKPSTDFFIDASHELSLFIWQNIKIENNNKLPPQREDSSIEGGSGISSDRIQKPGNPRKKSSKQDDDRTSGRLDGESPSVNGNSVHPKLYNRNGHKLLLTPAPYLCVTKAAGCAVYPRFTTPPCHPISPETIYFAIKTCHKFHKERVPAIKMTWGRYAVHKKFFSDLEDEDIPTKSTGIPNTETGHCGKTLSILKLVLADITIMNRILERPIEWIFLSDDDTLLSVTRICEILGCFDSSKDIYLGERYGYRMHSNDGFNYITGGGGIVFSLSTAHKIVDTCSCPSISSPDDMILGMCMQRHRVRAIHSSKFHQARPPDYASKLLSLDPPISFHKFWQIDPHYVYEKWFHSADNNCARKSPKNCDIHTSPSTKLAHNLSNGRPKAKNIKVNKPEHVDL